MKEAGAEEITLDAGGGTSTQKGYPCKIGIYATAEFALKGRIFFLNMYLFYQTS